MFSSQNSQVSSDANYIEDVFSTYLYTGNSTSAGTQTITNNIDLSTKGGMVWIKGRSNSNNSNLFDTVRGAGTGSSSTTNKALSSNSDGPQGLNITSDYLSAFNTNGFTVTQGGTTVAGRSTNYLNYTYASWTFREQPKFFDVVTFSGTGSAQTIAHNLGSAVGFLMVKRINGTGESWRCWHRSGGANNVLTLNSTDAKYTDSSGVFWNLTAPTSTQFSVGTETSVNASGGTYVAYLFAHDAGGFGLTGTDNVISCGSYTTDASGNATVNLGYEPQFVMYKFANSTSSWVMLDTMRGLNNTNDYYLLANLSDAEQNWGAALVKPTATGFTVNSMGGAYNIIYIAIRRGPMKVPTSGTSVFSPLKSTTTFTAGNTTGTLLSDWMWGRPRLSEGALNWFQSSRLTPRTMPFNASNAEDATQYVGFDTQTGVKWVNTWTSTAGDYGSWYFRRAPSFFDEVCYTGTGATIALNHNLAAVPELMIVKSRGAATGNWVTYTATYGSGSFIRINSTSGNNTGAGNLWGATTPTSSLFYVGEGGTGGLSVSANNYVAYLFATCAGVSKVGSYTGTATTKQVDCGFTGGARFVLIKRTDSTGDWYVWDSARGIVAGNDPYLLLNSTAAEVTSTDYIDTYSAGFEISSTAPAAINASGGTFIFLAIA